MKAVREDQLELGGFNLHVLIAGEPVPIDRSVFVDLLENSVANGRVPYLRALEKSQIQYSDLLELARRAEVPHPLFFAPSAVVRSQLRTKTAKLLQGVAPETFTVNSRTTVNLRDVELIVKDLLRKQALARKHDPTLVKNQIVGLLRKPRHTLSEDAKALINALGLDREAIRLARNKATALELIIGCLEANQVLVSRSVQNFMPQLIKVRFSGMTVRDSKVPYIFLAGGDHGDFQEPTGRQIFTLVLMAVLVARGIFAPVSYDANSTAPDAGREYDIVGEILMPAPELQDIPLNGLHDVKSASELFKVTPSAVAVRAMRLGRLSPLTTTGYLRELEMEFRARTKSNARQPKPVNAIRKYTGRALAARMLQAVDERRLSPGEFCRVVCLNRIGPEEIGELKAAVR